MLAVNRADGMNHALAGQLVRLRRLGLARLAATQLTALFEEAWIVGGFVDRAIDCRSVAKRIRTAPTTKQGLVRRIHNGIHFHCL